jgi:hypothetical protein
MPQYKIVVSQVVTGQKVGSGRGGRTTICNARKSTFHARGGTQNNTIHIEKFRALLFGFNPQAGQPSGDVAYPITCDVEEWPFP